MNLLQRLRRGLKPAASPRAVADLVTPSMFAPESPGRSSSPGQAAPVGINAHSEAWIASLPRSVRPVHLRERHPRVVNQLALCWKDHELVERVLASLIVDDRGGRQGFTPPVLAELLNLQEFHADQRHLDGCEPLWADSTLATGDR